MVKLVVEAKGGVWINETAISDAADGNRPMSAMESEKFEDPVATSKEAGRLTNTREITDDPE